MLTMRFNRKELSRDLFEESLETRLKLKIRLMKGLKSQSSLMLERSYLI